MPPELLVGKKTHGSLMLGYNGLGAANKCRNVIEMHGRCRRT